jgi:SAM-dependent methyltransferase
MEQRYTFDRVADLYDAVRPGYPADLFADLARTAGLTPGDRILEIGCGSGQATQDLADLAGPVLAIDPGAELIRLARRRLAERGQVAFAVSTFEAFSPEPHAFRLAAAAQAWHWVDPRLALPRAAQALAPGGWLAIFGHIPMPPASPVLEDMQAVHARIAPEMWGPTPESWYLPEGPVAGLIEGSGLFGPVVHHGYASTRTHTAESFGDLFGTISHYNAMAPDRRAALLSGLKDVIRAHGGRYRLPYETHLYMAPVKT